MDVRIALSRNMKTMKKMNQRAANRHNLFAMNQRMQPRLDKNTPRKKAGQENPVFTATRPCTGCSKITNCFIFTTLTLKRRHFGEKHG